MANIYKDTLESLHVLARLACEKTAGRQESSHRQFEEIGVKLRKIRELADDKRPPVVGVFGCPSRGKSYLLNTLLGVDLLPEDGITGTTRCAIELKRISTDKGNLAVYRNGIPQRDFDLSVKSLKNKLEGYARASGKVQDVEKLEIEIPACSPIDDKIIFMDTPGAEAGIIDAEEKGLLEDTKRTLKILSDADISIFCMRCDLLEAQSDVNFYKKHIQKLRPINVIGFKDEAGDEDDNDFINAAIQSYDVEPYDTCVISAKSMREAFKNWRNQNLMTKKYPEEILDNGNVKWLYDLIKKRIDMKDETVTAIKLFEVLQKYIFALKDAWGFENSIDLLPAPVYIENLYWSLKKTSETRTNLWNYFENVLRDPPFNLYKLNKGTSL
jgi:GTPase Era involved in 16S rRNA processing